MASFYSNGKLLITGEYLVLDGAKALAVPTKLGQALEVKPFGENVLLWESYTRDKNLWLRVEFALPDLKILASDHTSEEEGGHDNLAETLREVLLEARKLNANFLSGVEGSYARSNLAFKRDWGLGSSSTLINNVAQWAKVDAFELQFRTFGGSAYDIACAQNKGPVIYELNDKITLVEPVDFSPGFRDQLFFVHLNKKRNSRNAIEHYQKLKDKKGAYISQISVLTQKAASCTSLTEFQEILKEHEAIISKVIQTNPIQETSFKDYSGQIKSLGAWGGDFILAAGSNESPEYFKKKGFHTVIPFQKMVL